MTTALYACLLTLLFLALSARVILTRRRAHIGFGDAGDKLLRRRIRVHANFAEYVPLALVLMLMMEQLGAPSWSVHVAGLSLLLGRITHAIALSAEPELRTGRVLAMTMTLSMLLFSVATILMIGISHCTLIVAKCWVL